MSYLDERRQHIMNGRPLPEKKKYTIPKVSDKRRKKLAEQKFEGSDISMDEFFKQQRPKMTGKCAHCSKPSCKNDDKMFHFSIAHLLPKAYVPSVATNENNWIELCFWGENSCHTQLDNKILDLTDLNCWDEVVVKFQKMYPLIAPNERRRIPEALLQYLNTDL
jgi:hypothetical protein